MLIERCDELPDYRIQLMIKTSFVEVVCDNYEALVEEKRKRTDKEDGTSKRHNTRNAGKEGQAQPMPRKEVGETRMKTDGSQ